MERLTEPGTVMPLSMPLSLRQRFYSAVPAGERNQFVRNLPEREFTEREVKLSTGGSAVPVAEPGAQEQALCPG